MASNDSNHALANASGNVCMSAGRSDMAETAALKGKCSSLQMFSAAFYYEGQYQGHQVTAIVSSDRNYTVTSLYH